MDAATLEVLAADWVGEMGGFVGLMLVASSLLFRFFGGFFSDA